MSDPNNPYSPTPPGGYPPPGAPYVGYGQPVPRRRPGCWVWGGLTCLTLALIFAAVVAIFGWKFYKTYGKQIAAATKTVTECSQRMGQVRAAILRYHEHTGQYPPTLSALAPNYIASAADLHCSMDKNTDPTHPTFAYKAPAPSTSVSAPNVPLLSFHLSGHTSPTGLGTQAYDFEYILCLDGNLVTNSNQTIHTPDGGTTHTHNGSNLTLGPGSTGDQTESSPPGGTGMQ